MYFKYSKLAENEFDKKMIELTEEYQAFINRNTKYYNNDNNTYNRDNYFEHFPMGLYLKLKDAALREIELEKAGFMSGNPLPTSLGDGTNNSKKEEV